MNYVRGINQQFIDDLKSGCLEPLLDVVKNDDDLQLEIRNGYINIYYQGGNLLKITPKKRRYAHGNNYNFYFDTKYCLCENDRELIKSIKKDDLVAWVMDVYVTIPNLQQIMDDWFEKNNKIERKVQQRFSGGNIKADSQYFVIDVEYQVGNKSRVDMLVLRRDDTGVKIVLVELKQGYKSVAGKSGLVKHYRDFAWLIKNHSAEIRKTVQNIYANKVELGLIPDCFDLPDEMDFGILFMLYDYPEHSIQLSKAESEINALDEGINYDIAKIPVGTFIIKDVMPFVGR